MTRVLHRAIAHSYPVAVSGSGIHIRDAARQGLHRCQRRRGGVVPRPRSSRRAGGHARSARQTGLCAHELFHDAGRRRTGRRPDRACAARHQPRLLRQRRVGGHRGVAEDGAAVFRGEGRAAAPPLHRPPAELPRQHAGRLGRRRQRMAPQAVRAAADRRASCLAVLRVSRAAARRDAGAIRRAAGPGTRRQDPRARPGYRHGLRGRNGRAARRPDAFRRSKATSSASARSATATASC